MGGSPGKILELPKRKETIVSGCARRGNSDHCLNELQRQVRAAFIRTDTRDGHETLRLLLQDQEACVKAQFTIHTAPPESLCSPPLFLIQEQLPQENTQHTSGCCNFTLPSATTGSPRILYPSLPLA